MTINSLNDFSTDPTSNTDIGGTDISVGCPPQDVGVFMRTIMAFLAYAVQGTGGPIPATWHVGSLITTIGGHQPGDFIPIAGPTVAAGRLICWGQAVSRTTYALLFAAIGTTWGAGDGSTTFNVPDLRGRSLFGADPGTGRLTAASLGQAANLGVVGGHELLQFHGHGVGDPGHAHGVFDPGHGHGVGDPGHAHTVPSNTFQGGGPNGLAPNGLTTTADQATTASGTGVFVGASLTNIGIFASGTGIGIAGAGGGGSQNLPPAAICQWSIYAGV